LDSFLICISLLVLSLGTYIIWPSRFNVLQHLAVGGSFVSIFVPSVILNVQNAYPQAVVDLYIRLLVIGTFAFTIGLVIGSFSGRGIRTNFSFDIMDPEIYQKKVIILTRNLMLIGIIGLVLSYLVMGFVPMFAKDPISAKLFRGEYQAPYIRVAVIYRSCFYILATIMPITCIIWYITKSNFFLFLIVAALTLMAVSLARSGAFMGVVVAFAIVMSFKSRIHFAILMTILIAVFVLSSFFYYIVGVRTYTGEKNVWEIITAGTPDITDHLDFLGYYEQRPELTYGKTIYGGLIPGHYKWNPAVYTLLMVNPGQDINDIGSGGLRLPLPFWGFVSFEWPGVIVFSFLTGFLTGLAVRMTKDMFLRHPSVLIRTVIIIGFGSIAGIIANFMGLNLYNFPPAIVSLFYLYRFKIK